MAAATPQSSIDWSREDNEKLARADTAGGVED
jgi:hypothetical protein